MTENDPHLKAITDALGAAMEAHPGWSFAALAQEIHADSRDDNGRPCVRAYVLVGSDDQTLAACLAAEIIERGVALVRAALNAGSN